MAHHLPAEFIVPREVGFDTYQNWSELREHCPQGTLFYSRLHKQYFHLHSPKRQKHLTISNSLHPVNVKPEHKTWVLLMG